MESLRSLSATWGEASLLLADAPLMLKLSGALVGGTGLGMKLSCGLVSRLLLNRIIVLDARFLQQSHWLSVMLRHRHFNIR